MRFTRRGLIGAGAAALGGAWLEARAAADPYADGVLVGGEPPLPAAGAFTFAVLPDTQNYAEHFPATFTAQTEWLVAQRERRRIAAVFHLGDVTNHNVPAEWANARKSLGLLDEAGLPWCLVPGNHDYGPGGTAADRTTLLGETLPVADRRGRPWWGGSYEREPDRADNTFALVEAAGRKFLVLGLEFGPRADVVRWANEVVGDHRDHEVVLLTHAFVYHDDTRYDWRTKGRTQTHNPHDYPLARASGDDVHDGEQLWERLVARHGNFILAINGHVAGDGLGRLATRGVGDREIEQFVVNFQFRPAGGDGWLRLVEMRPDGTARTFDYSPTRGERNESPQNQFALRIPAIARG